MNYFDDYGGKMPKIAFASSSFVRISVSSQHFSTVVVLQITLNSEPHYFSVF